MSTASPTQPPDHAPSPAERAGTAAGCGPDAAAHHRGAPPAPPRLADHAAGYARLALANVTRPYPYAPAYVLRGPADLVEPAERHPAFHGAYDWHSGVHMHWLLVRLLRRCPDRIEQAAVTAVLDRHLTEPHLAAEAARLRAEPGWERPYGWAWLLALAAECRLAGPVGERWADALAPVAGTVAALLRDWLPHATYPVRHGTHGNSAFALGLVLDAAPAADQADLLPVVREVLLRWFGDDHDAPVHWEPSGQDFLSPTLSEADAVRRVLPVGRFADWLRRFWPQLTGETGTGMAPPVVSDLADPQIGHLAGLSLSRAAALRSLAAALPPGDPRIPALRSAADAHLAAGLPHVASGDFTTVHWLPTFATLALDGPAPGAPAPD